ncbi:MULTISPECIES: T9SS type A sorting domain-containing protein [unclassified Arcicella]|uniref:T9SS type A sorting domain-containing protein n=1 Tax=unclassified Arcicella TaxID=2644986 RepID=UPI002865D945|nr:MULTISPECIES: T9SS type A sorting domain-containing protein [unclassified Arcicella]MDR6562096.1 hypothetical protein [Arcicella sp. BE51]MDR6811968.1 hypothetical protein [Arcicella sp. BE140]MDR6822998.1 hypothetical protein [Arcicella sp. BE139]
MIKSLQFSLLLMFFTFALKGQTIGITQVQSEINSTICLGKKVLVSYSKTGTFNKENTFKLQVKSSYLSEGWISLETKDSSGYLVAVLPNEIPNTNGNYNYADFQIVSSSPIVISPKASYQNMYFPAEISLIDLQKKTLFPYEPVLMDINYSGSLPITLLMSDSTFVYINTNNYTSQQSIIVTPNKTGKYSIIGASNTCGIGKSSGSTDIKIFDNSLKIIGNANTHICKNGKVSVSVSKAGKWTTGNKFTIRLADYATKTKFYDFEATDDDGVFSANIGSSIPIGSYWVKILASDNGIESDYSFNYVSVHNEFKVELITSSTTIKYGEQQQLIASVTGFGNYIIELNDGQIYNNYYIGDDSNRSVGFKVSPKQTTEYYINSYSSGCGNGTGKNKVLITVDKGIKTDSVKAGKYCEGTSNEVYFSSNVNLPVGSTVKVRMMNNGYLGTGEYRDVDATIIRENVASFIIPTNLISTFYSYTFYVSVFTNNITGISLSTNTFDVSTFPSGVVGNKNSIVINLDKPQTTDIELTLKGGGPYEITLSDSLKYKYDTEQYAWERDVALPIFVPKTTVIGIKSISNICGTNNTPYSTYKYVTVQNAEYSIRVISKKLQSEVLCAGDKIDLSIIATGKYGADNKFTVELVEGSNYNNSSKNLGTITLGSTQIVIPNDVVSGKYSIRVSSNSPLYYSNMFPVTVRTLPTAKFYTYYTEPVLSGESSYTELNLKGGGIQTVIYKDGTKQTIETSNYNYGEEYRLSSEKKLTKTTTFGIQSVSNLCGIGTIQSKDFTITVKPYTIQNQITQYGYSIYCTKEKLLVPFDIKGQIDKNASYSVQIANNTDTAYTTLQSNIKQSPATVSLPTDIKAGYYKVRVINHDKSIKSEPYNITLRSAPDISLQFSNGEIYTEIDAGNGVYIRSNTSQDYSGNTLTYVIGDDKKIKTTGYNNYNYIEEYKTPNSTTTYTLLSAVNRCGVGKVSGSVTVMVKPVLNMDIKNTTYGSNLCIGSSMDVTLNSRGTFEPNNIFKIYAVDESNVKTELLKASKNGEYKLIFGNDYKKGSYKIQMESSNPYQLKDVRTIFLTSKVDISISGQATINAGSEGAIQIKNNDPYKPNTNTYFSDVLYYELSNGSTGSIDLYYFSSPRSIYVYPQITQTYTLKSVTNACGLGKADGSATITVNPASTKQVNLYSYVSNYCEGSTTNVYFTTVGSFSASNKFTAQLSDNTGKNFKNLEAVENGTSSLKVKIPSNLVLGSGYYMRVLASDNDATSITNIFPYTIVEGVTARFDTSSYYFNSNKPVTINIKLTGTPPFMFAIGIDEISAKTYSSSAKTFPIPLNPIANSSYRLFSVSNQVCGTGTILSPSTVKLELITATEEAGKLGINVFPNPTSDIINIESDGKELDIQLIDFLGKIIHAEKLKGEQKQLYLSKTPAGTYFLHIQKEGKQAVFKVLKQ